MLGVSEVPAWAIAQLCAPVGTAATQPSTFGAPCCWVNAVPTGELSIGSRCMEGRAGAWAHAVMRGSGWGAVSIMAGANGLHQRSGARAGAPAWAYVARRFVAGAEDCEPSPFLVYCGGPPYRGVLRRSPPFLA